MANLLKETEDALKALGYTWNAIVAIQGNKHRISIEHFKKIANVEYDNGYGAPEVATDLTIILNDGCWLTRGEYDGSEWWAYHKAPAVIPECSDDKITSVVVSPEQVGFCTLGEINGVEKENDNE